MAQIAIGGTDRPARLTTADGTPLKQALGRVELRAKTRAFLLVAPLLVFLSITFLFPIGQMLFRSVHDPLVSQILPNTLAALEDWSAEDGLPPEEAFEALAQELALARENRFTGDLGRVATTIAIGVRQLVAVFRAGSIRLHELLIALGRQLCPELEEPLRFRAIWKAAVIVYECADGDDVLKGLARDMDAAAPLVGVHGPAGVLNRAAGVRGESKALGSIEFVPGIAKRWPG